MTLDPRALLVLLVATCFGVMLMAYAHAEDAGDATLPTPRTPTDAGSLSAVNAIPKPIATQNGWSQPHA